MERLGKFEILERLGDGGMAEVFLARPLDAALSKLVAVKRILPSHSEDEAFIEMFRREAEIALRMRHPGIVSVYELGFAEGQHYLSMEFFPGVALSRLARALRDQKVGFDFPDALFVARQIAEALQYMHSFQAYGAATEIIHRDVSPQNILVGVDGAVKLIDFGIAKVIDKDSRTKTSVVKGKMAYLSPEQIRGAPLTKQTDIFSLGIVLWEMVAGRKLFAGASMEAVAKKIEACEIPPILAVAPSAPAAVDLICRRALARLPQDRYRTAEEMISDLDEALRDHKRESHQKRVAEAVKLLFPEEVAKLQGFMRKYEGASVERSPMRAGKAGARASLTPEELTRAMPAPERRGAPFASSSATSGAKRSSQVVVGENDPTVVAGRGARRLRGPHAAARGPELPARPSGRSLSASWRFAIAGSAICALTAGILIATRDVGPRPSAARGEGLTAVPAAGDAPKAETSPVHPGAELGAPPAAPFASRPTEMARPWPTPAPSPMRAARLAPSSGRKPASARAPTPGGAPAPVAFAYLTVFADRGAKILVDGVSAGVELVNERKVPAGKQIVVQSVSASGQASPPLRLVLKAYSKHIVDLSTPNR